MAPPSVLVLVSKTSRDALGCLSDQATQATAKTTLVHCPFIIHHIYQASERLVINKPALTLTSAEWRHIPPLPSRANGSSLTSPP